MLQKETAMHVESTEHQQQAVRNGEAVRVRVPGIATDLVVLRAEEYDRLRECREDEQERAAWAKLTRKAANRQAAESPF
jgi:hypothetical protein